MMWNENEFVDFELEKQFKFRHPMQVSSVGIHHNTLFCEVVVVQQWRSCQRHSFCQCTPLSGARGFHYRRLLYITIYIQIDSGIFVRIN